MRSFRDGKDNAHPTPAGRIPELRLFHLLHHPAPRGHETDGKDYHFLSVEEFLRRREAGFFAEWANVHGNYYGTPLAPVLET